MKKKQFFQERLRHNLGLDDIKEVNEFLHLIANVYTSTYILKVGQQQKIDQRHDLLI